MKTKIILFLIVIGFILRFAGIFFNGNHNFDTYHEWGYNTRTKGLAHAYNGSYGPVTYLILGFADSLASATPQIWWMPYKAANLLFEILILFVLFRFLPKHKLETVILYWLNPWFLIPGSWAGFWDAAHLFFILLALVFLDFREKRNFFMSGLMLGTAFCVKPQAVAAISVMAIFFLVFKLIRFKFKEFIQFSTGLMLLPFIFNFYFFINAIGANFFFQEYSRFRLFMPYLVNSEINIWHTITRVIMFYQNMTGPIFSLDTTTYPYNLIEKAAYIIFLLLLVFYMIKSFLRKSDTDKLFFTKSFALPFILMPQILTRSHAYHFYTATILLIPLIIESKDRRLYIFWAISIAIHFFNIFAAYGFGRSIINPFPIHFWREPFISVFGFIQFLASIGLVYAIFVSDKKKMVNNYKICAA